MPASKRTIKDYPIAVLQRLLADYPDKGRLKWFLETCTVGARIEIDPEGAELPDRLDPTEPTSFSWGEKVGVYKAFLKWTRLSDGCTATLQTIRMATGSARAPPFHCVDSGGAIVGG